MKTLPFFTAALLFISAAFYAQQDKREQIRSLKVAYLTEALSLTPAEAQKFWPLYNAYDDQQFDIRAEKLKNLKARFNSNPDGMTDKEAQLLLTQMDNTEDKLYENKKKFYQNVKTVLGPVKILKLRKAEDDFNRRLLKQYRDKKRAN